MADKMTSIALKSKTKENVLRQNSHYLFGPNVCSKTGSLVRMPSNQRFERQIPPPVLQ